jgi:hypothetical protein
MASSQGNVPEVSVDRFQGSTLETVDPLKFGVSFSVKQCRDFGIDSKETLGWLITEAGFRRFRLMSYWNECEKEQGTYSFDELDRQVKQVETAGGVITLCLGVRQPRYPESHWPDWALKLPQTERYQALGKFIQTVVERYKENATIVSYQLENEALNRSFGLNGDFNRKRLRDEFALVKKLDPSRPLIMSTSNSYGLPFRRPIPDIIGFSLYRVMYMNGRYTFSKLPVWLHNVRAFIAKLFLRRPSFIHELQLEPWGPKAIWEMPVEEQDESMSVNQIRENVHLAKSTRLYPIDLWGGEWWYWRLKVKKDPTIWQTVKEAISNT